MMPLLDRYGCLLSPCDNCSNVIVENIWNELDCYASKCPHKEEYNKQYIKRYGRPYDH